MRVRLPTTPLLFLWLLATLGLRAETTVATEEICTTHFSLLVGYPEVLGGTTNRVLLVPGVLIPITEAKEESNEDRQILEKSISFGNAAERLWSTFRLDSNRRRQEGMTANLVAGRALELPFLKDLAILMSVTLQRSSDTVAFYRVLFQHQGKPIVDSVVQVAKGGRAVVGGMDGIEAPYLFLFIEPDPPAKVPSSSPGGKVREEIVAPQILERAPVEYPSEAKKEMAQGEVILEVTVDEEGKVTEVILLKDPDARLSQAAKESVLHWRFKPAMRQDGKPVKVKTSITIRFALK